MYYNINSLEDIALETEMWYNARNIERFVKGGRSHA